MKSVPNSKQRVIQPQNWIVLVLTHQIIQFQILILRLKVLSNTLKNKTPSSVTTSINNWIKALVGNMDLKEIASGLEDLKEGLSKKMKKNRWIDDLTGRKNNFIGRECRR